MNICGIVAEYNPLHNGHIYHFGQARELSGCDYTVVVMSGHFVQRGEAAVWDKWTRARHALRCGADMVIELPAAYALNNAQWFAYGGVGILHALGADCLAFGSESGDMATLQRLAAGWQHEDDATAECIRANIRRGLPHPAARAQALQNAGQPAPEQPNDTLAAMYLYWLEQLGSTMRPLAIPRKGAGYHSLDMSLMASATAIRTAMAQGLPWQHCVPEAVQAEREPMQNAELLETLLLQAARNKTADDTGGGLDKRIRAAARQAGTYGEFLQGAKTKAYTMARIKRTVLRTAIGMDAQGLEQIYREKPLHAHILGVRRAALPLLAHAGKTADIPILAGFAGYWPTNAAQQTLMAYDEQASDLYALAQKRPAGQDYTRKFMIVEDA